MTDKAIPSDVTFQELKSPHYWCAKYRYDGDTEVVARRNLDVDTEGSASGR